LADLKLIMIPDPLYWYRSNTQGRYRTSHWYDNRQPILAAYRKHEFKGLEYAYHLIMAQNVSQWERQGYRTNLRFSPSDAKYLELCDAEPNSEKALSLLARIAASEGRPETGMTLLTGLPHLEFNNQSRRLLDTESSREKVLKVTGTAFTAGHTLTHQELLSLESSTTGPVNDPASLFYVESPDRFFLQAEDSSISLAVLPAGCPAGTVAVSAKISLDQALSEKAEFMIMVCAMHEDPVLAVQTGSAKPSEGYSGWIEVAEPFRPTTIEARLSTPSATPSNLIFAVRNAKGGIKSVLGCFAGINILNSAADAVKRRPRIGAPAHKLRAREWTDKERKSAHLITKYRSDLPLMLLPPEGQGIFLRPSLSGPVVAVIDEGFPAFARRLLAKVEIAHEEASPFEFAIALNLLSKPTQWKPAGPVNAIAFSGWIRVNERFKLHDIKLGLRELISSPLSINLAIRVPKGSAPSPSNAFWRNLIFMWDE
jgi:hypothetical protein